MTAMAYYLLKVILCSGILFFYYQVALRNKVFHQWNRFYLLAAVVLPLVLPVVQIDCFDNPTGKDNAAQLLRSFQQADNILEAFIVTNKPGVTPETMALFAYGFVSFIIFIIAILSLLKIVAILRSHTVKPLGGVKFVNTQIAGTPFSFFRYIFWNQNISLQSSAGRQIFQHEMVHVEEKHTVDKLFMQTVLIFLWCNPFFWLIRKELHAIHEFSADQKSVEQYDTAAFAAMILQAAYPKHFNAIINPFFQTSIKRRIAMLTKMQNPVVSYVSRMIALPLIAITICAFTVRTNDAKNSERNSPIRGVNVTVHTHKNTTPATDTLPKKTKEIKSVDVRKDGQKKISELTITYADGTSEKMSGKEAEKRGLIKNSSNGNAAQVNKKGAPKKGIQIREAGKGEDRPLFFLDGKEISKEEMNKIDPNTIESVNVLKDKHATDKYGDKGKNGVVEITSKNDGKMTMKETKPVSKQTLTPTSVNQ